MAIVEASCVECDGCGALFTDAKAIYRGQLRAYANDEGWKCEDGLGEFGYALDLCPTCVANAAWNA